jgi:hypothetical protein
LLDGFQIRHKPKLRRRVHFMPALQYFKGECCQSTFGFPLLLLPLNDNLKAILVGFGGYSKERHG